MKHASSYCALIALVAVSTACGVGPTSPSRMNAAIPTSSTQPAQPASSVAVSGPSRIFSFDHELTYGVSDYTKKSRFVLYDNGTFVLEYPSCLCSGSYSGNWTETNGVITFVWAGWSAAGPWGATGTVEANTLTVHYNLIMQLTDFEDAAYSRID